MVEQRNAADAEIGKLQRWVDATLPMLPPETAKKWKAALNSILGRQRLVPRFSLADSISQLIKANDEVALTVSDIKDTLVGSGFDFSSYRSNPISSISTTLRRMVKRGEVHTEVIEGVNVYYTGDKTKGQLETIAEARKKRK